MAVAPSIAAAAFQAAAAKAAPKPAPKPVVAPKPAPKPVVAAPKPAPAPTYEAPGAADALAGDGNVVNPQTGRLVDVTTPGSPNYGGTQPGGSGWAGDIPAPPAYDGPQQLTWPDPYVETPAPEADPAQDPSYLAYQRALQQSEENMRADIARQIAAMKAKVASAMPLLDESLKQGTHDLQYRHAGNGTYNSSARLNDENTLQTAIGRQKDQLNTDEFNSEGDIQSTLTRFLAQNQAGLAEQGIAARQRLSSQYAASEAAKKSKYLAELGAVQRQRAQMSYTP